MIESVLLTDTQNPAISVLTLNRPNKRNALNLALIERITDTVSAAAADPLTRVLIICGADPVFCAGLDLAEAASPESAEKSAIALSRMYLEIGTSPLVTIAAAQGAAMGGGAGLLAACDFVVAAGDLRIAYPEVRRGLVAALVTCLLRRQASDRIVRELILLGEEISAARALELGLVSRVVPAEQVLAAAHALASSALLGAPGAIERTKRLLDQIAPRTLHADLERAVDYHLSARQSPEAEEGMAAFREKRPPRWGPRLMP